MVRIERDTLGWVDVPDDVYYGPQTTRAIRNFRVSTLKLPPAFIRAQAEIKMACARANMTGGTLDFGIGEYICQAASEVRIGTINDQFVVDAYQSGAGTSQNMNANEVIANRALELMGLTKGQYDVIHPRSCEHVLIVQ